MIKISKKLYLNDIVLNIKIIINLFNYI